MSRPRISVIIPVYNSAAFFENTLRRVLRQQSPAHEIIVVNDGSTDGTQAVLDKYKDRIISKTIPNSGCSVARNEGVRLSSGDALAFLDADDLWFSKKLKVMSGFLERFPGVDFFCSDYLVYYERDRRIVRHYDYLPNRRAFNFNEPLRELPLKLFLANNFVGTPSAAVIRKGLFERLGGFDSACRLVEDLDFFLRAAVRTDVVVVREALFYKHNHEENMSFDKVKVYESHKQLLLKNLPDLQSYIRRHQLEKDAALGLAGVNYQLGGAYFDAGSKKKAFGLFWEAFRSAPYAGNFLSFLWAVTKKTARVLSFDLLSRKIWRKLFHSRT
jgi:glycosyltransferase involved in cell wall biosynthesis